MQSSLQATSVKEEGSKHILRYCLSYSKASRLSTSTSWILGSHSKELTYESNSDAEKHSLTKTLSFAELRQIWCSFISSNMLNSEFSRKDEIKSVMNLVLKGTGSLNKTVSLNLSCFPIKTIPLAFFFIICNCSSVSTFIAHETIFEHCQPARSFQIQQIRLVESKRRL